MAVFKCSAYKRLCLGIIALSIGEVAEATMVRQASRSLSGGLQLAKTKKAIISKDVRVTGQGQPAAVDVTTKVPTFAVEFSFDWHPRLETLKDVALNYGFFIAFSWLLWIIVALTACGYKKSPRYFPELGTVTGDAAKLQKSTSQWQVEWYQCCVDPRICFWSCCCPCIRWAHTMDLLGFVDYGPAVAIFFMLQCMSFLNCFVTGIVFLMVLAYYRQRLRKAFDMPKAGTCIGYFQDCLCFCFCMACILAQEAMHVERSAELGLVLPALMARQRDVIGVHGDSEVDNSALTRLPLVSIDTASPVISSSVPSFHDVNSKSDPSSGSNESLLAQDADLRDNGGIRGSAEFGRGLSPTVARARGVVSAGRRQYGRTSWLIQNPTPERLLAPPPVRLGAHGEVRGKISFVQLLGMLHDDLRAYVFLFVEVGCVGHCAASCRSLLVHIWTDRAFWHFYVGSGVNDRLAQPSACPAAHMREAFRRWIFHIDGAWTKDLRDFVEGSGQSRFEIDQVVMLSYARYIASGLMPYDSRSSVAEFAGIVRELLAEFNPRDADSRQEAEALTAQIECMGEVFTVSQIKEVVSAFDCSLGRISSSEDDVEENAAFPNAEIQVIVDVED